MEKLLFIVAIIFSCYIVKAEEFWEELDFPDKTTSIGILKVDKNDHLYVGTNNWLYKTTDRGNSWIQIKDGLESASISRIIVDSLNNLYVSSDPKGIYFSSDGGLNWEKRNNGISLIDTSLYFAASECDLENNLFLSRFKEQTYKSSNQGKTWENITSNTILDNVTLASILIDTKNNLYVTPLGVDTNYKGGMFYSNDNGTTWDQIIEYSMGKIYFTRLNNIDEMFVCFKNKGLFKSKDQGKTFEIIYPQEGTNFINWMYINEQNHIFLFYEKRGILRSIDDGLTWENIDSNKFSEDVYPVTSDKAGYLYASINRKGLFRSKYPMKLFYLGYNIMPRYNDTAKFDYGDTVTYTISIVDKSNGRPVINANIQIKNNVLNSNETFNTDTLGILNYSFIIPQGQDTGTYKLQLYLEKFGYEKHDTIEKTIHIVHSDVWVNQISKSRNIEILPNPTNDKIQIRIPDIETGTTEIWLTTLTGSCSFLFAGTLGKGTEILTFNLSSYSSGIYFINVQTKNQIHSEPLILLR